MDVVRAIHLEGGRAVGRLFLYAGGRHYELHEYPTGTEGFWLVNKDPLEVKKQTCKLEEKHPLGRLFYMDVLNAQGASVSRRDLGLPPRRCLICGEEAAVCARSRAHAMEDLLAVIRQTVAAVLGRGS